MFTLQRMLNYYLHLYFFDVFYEDHHFNTLNLTAYIPVETSTPPYGEDVVS